MLRLQVHSFVATLMCILPCKLFIAMITLDHRKQEKKNPSFISFGLFRRFENGR